MPSLMRFLVGLAVVAAIGAGAVFALGTMVTPSPREIVIKVPQERFEAR